MHKSVLATTSDCECGAKQHTPDYILYLATAAYILPRRDNLISLNEKPCSNTYSTITIPSEMIETTTTQAKNE